MTDTPTQIAASQEKQAISPGQMVFLWFGGFVMLGTFFLMLPVAQLPNQPRIGFTNALFTSVSAACVTGLTVVNVAETFSFWGQLAIFILMEGGGMGIMTFASLGFRLLGRRMSMEQQAATTEAIYQNDAAGEFKNTFWRILRITAGIQLLGAVGMLITLYSHAPEGTDSAFLVWSAFFHASSAFCNSGFTLYADGLMGHTNNIPFLLILLGLVLAGSLGHLVLNELWALPGELRKRRKKIHILSLHTKVVLTVTAGLLVFGVLSIWACGTAPKTHNLWHAVFETLSGRTAGFSIMDQNAMPMSSLILVMLLMFIGGSPGSCAGGIKTTSIAIWIGRVAASLRGDTNVNLFGYTISTELVARARILMALTVLWNLLGVFVLALCHPYRPLAQLLFEQISAFGTVGLSMDFTPLLSTGAKYWVTLSMFFGRLGPLSIALMVVRPNHLRIGRPVGRIMVG